MQKHRRFLLGIACALFALSTAASAQTIQIDSGNGQLLCPFCPGTTKFQFDPMVVLVKDAAGNPLANQTVTWQVTQGPATLNTATTVTDANGKTSNTIFQPGAGLGPGSQLLPVVQSVINASISTGSVNFVETTASLVQGGVNPVNINLLTPVDRITGQAGSVGSSVQVQVSSPFGGIPGILMRLLPANTDPNVGPTVQCANQPGLQAGTVLTDATGVATCNLQFGGKLGESQFSINVGGGDTATFSNPFNYVVTVGPAKIITINSGNNQTGTAGQTLPGTLLATVTDMGGNPVPNASVVWEVAQGSAQITNASTASDANGRVSARVTLGNTSGPVQVRVRSASDATVSATFNFTNSVVFSSLVKQSGDNQTAVINQAFGQPLVVQVVNQGQPVAGVSVAFAVASGTVTLSAPSAVTNAQGQASITVTAGATQGPATVTASAGSFSATFSLTVLPPGPQNLHIYSTPYYQTGSPGTLPGGENQLAPCSVATITGSSLAPGIQGVVYQPFVGPLPLLVNNTSVQFGDSFAPIFNVMNVGGQESITIQVPCEVQPGAQTVTIKVGTSTATMNVTVKPAAPAIFETVMTDNVRRAVLVKPDGSFVTLQNPARAGELVRMYVTGLGVTSPAVSSNSLGIPNTESTVNVGNIIVGVANGGVRVVSARYAAGMIGVYEVQFEVPSGVATGNNIPLAIAVVDANGNLNFGNPSAIPIQ